MIVGHLGVVAAVAVARRRTSLAWLVVAAVSPDLVDIGFALAGICNPYGLYSHTVPAAALLAAALAGGAVLAGRRETAAVIPLVVLLHLPLDYVTGLKLYWPGGELHGLSLYERPLLDFAVETVLLAVGWAALRRRVGTAKWLVGVPLLLALCAVQAVANTWSGRSLKPSACDESAAIASLHP